MMKIVPPEKVQATIKPASVEPKEKPSPRNFASVFEQKTAGLQHPAQGAMAPVPPLMPPIKAMSTGTSFHARTASDLVDRLDQYRQLMADPTVSLRDLAPTVEKMRKQSDGARKMLETISQDEPAKGILQEAVLVVSTEVERFNLGVYVEE